LKSCRAGIVLNTPLHDTQLDPSLPDSSFTFASTFVSSITLAFRPSNSTHITIECLKGSSLLSSPVTNQQHQRLSSGPHLSISNQTSLHCVNPATECTSSNLSNARLSTSGFRSDLNHLLQRTQMTRLMGGVSSAVQSLGGTSTGTVEETTTATQSITLLLTLHQKSPLSRNRK